jgi:hypothetical protein
MRPEHLSAVALALALVTSACAVRRSTDYLPPPVPTVEPTSTARTDGLASFDIRANDDSYTSPDQISAGRVWVSLHNAGHQQRNAQFFRVDDGVTLAQVAAAFQTDPRSVVELMTFAGGPGTVPPGGTQQVVQDLAEGQYVMATLLLGEDGQQYVPRGMFKPFRVIAPTAPTVTQSPGQLPGDEHVILSDFAFGIPPLAAGTHALRVDNVGKEPHEILVKRLAPHKTVTDALSFVLGPVGTPPYSDSGGVLVFPSGRSTTLTLDLAPGPYVAICYFRDAATGKTHAELGMIRDFTVD